VPVVELDRSGFEPKALFPAEHLQEPELGCLTIDL